MRVYWELLRAPGVARIIAAQLTARLPSGMLSLALLIHLEQVYGSYGAAGLVLAATSVGQAIAGPLTSRWMGVVGMRQLLVPTTLLCAASITSIALIPMPLMIALLVGFVGGFATPPVPPAVRTIYPTMVSARQLTPLFSLDASAQEIIWVAGPVVTAFVATQLSSVLALLLAAGIMLAGGLWFVLSPEVGRVRVPRSRHRLGRVLRKPTVTLPILACFLLLAACAAVEAGVVATFGEDGAESGIVLAIWSIGSLFGGLLLGHHSVSPWTLARRLSFMLVGVALASLWLQFWWLTATLLIAGLGIAPTFAACYSIISASVKFSDTTEAYGWMSTGQLIGAAIGSALAGFAIDAVGPVGGYWAAAAYSLVAVMLAVVARRWLPDLRGRDITPLADTEPTPTQSRTH